VVAKRKQVRTKNPTYAANPTLLKRVKSLIEKSTLICTNLQQGKCYFSINTKKGVEKYLIFRILDIELGHIVKRRHTKITTRLQHFFSFIGKATKLKEPERADCENYYHRHRVTNSNVPQVTIKKEQSTINAFLKWLNKNGKTHIDSFEFKKLPTFVHKHCYQFIKTTI
tara:strand:+ start:208 stop:714 length:507 start_codon:yes stop_codon:yes gene_type:complete